MKINLFNQEKLSLKQLSTVLNISEITAKKLAKEGEIPCKFVNRRFLFDINEVINYFKILEEGAA